MKQGLLDDDPAPEGTKGVKIIIDDVKGHLFCHHHHLIHPRPLRDFFDAVWLG